MEERYLPLEQRPGGVPAGYFYSTEYQKQPTPVRAGEYIPYGDRSRIIGMLPYDYWKSFYGDEWNKRHQQTMRALGVFSPAERPYLRAERFRSYLPQPEVASAYTTETPFAAEVSEQEKMDIARSLAGRGLSGSASLYKKQLRDVALGKLPEFTEEEKQRLRKYINPKTGTLYGVVGERQQITPGSVAYSPAERYIRIGTRKEPVATEGRLLPEEELERIRRLYQAT